MSDLIPLVSNYDNDLDLEEVGKLMRALLKAWRIAADAGINPKVKHGDNDEADGISLVMSQIRMKYQDKASQEQRLAWRDEE